MTVTAYIWPDGSVKVSHDGPYNRDRVPQQVPLKELAKAQKVELDINTGKIQKRVAALVVNQ